MDQFWLFKFSFFNDTLNNKPIPIIDAGVKRQIDLISGQLQILRIRIDHRLGRYAGRYSEFGAVGIVRKRGEEKEDAKEKNYDKTY